MHAFTSAARSLKSRYWYLWNFTFKNGFTVHSLHCFLEHRPYLSNGIRPPWAPWWTLRVWQTKFLRGVSWELFRSNVGLAFSSEMLPDLVSQPFSVRLNAGVRYSGGEGNSDSSILAWRIPWQRSLVGYSPWGRKVSDTTESHTHTHTHTHTHPVAQLRSPWGRKVSDTTESLTHTHTHTHTHTPSGSVEEFPCWVLQAQSRLVRLVTRRECTKAKRYFATVTWLSILLTIGLSFPTNCVLNY